MPLRMQQGSLDWLRPYMMAAQLTAESNNVLARGIEQAGAAVGGAISAKKIRAQQQSNWERNFQMTLADRQADNDRAILPYLDKEEAALHSQMEDATGDPEFGIPGDPDAAKKIQDRLLEIGNSRGVLMGRLGLPQAAPMSKPQSGQTPAQSDFAKRTAGVPGADASMMRDLGYTPEGMDQPSSAASAPVDPHDHQDGTVCEGGVCRKEAPAQDDDLRENQALEEAETAAKTHAENAKSLHERGMAMFRKGHGARAKAYMDAASLEVTAAGAAGAKAKTLQERRTQAITEQTRIADEQRKRDLLLSDTTDELNTYGGQETTDEATFDNGSKIGGTTTVPYAPKSPGEAKGLLDQAKAAQKEKPEELASARSAYKDQFGEDPDEALTATDLRSAITNNRVVERMSTRAKATEALAAKYRKDPAFARAEAPYKEARDDALVEYRAASNAYYKADILSDPKQLKANLDETKKAVKEAERKHAEFLSAWDGGAKGVPSENVASSLDEKIKAIEENDSLTPEQKIEQLKGLRGAGSR